MSASYQYVVNGQIKPAGFKVAFYRSSDTHIGDSNDVLLGSTFVLGRNASAGTHSMTYTVSLPPDPRHPFVFAVADPNHSIAEWNEDNNSAFFEKHIIVVVTHGFTESGMYSDTIVPEMAATLQRFGYQDVLPFDWAADSNQAQPGMTVLAGLRMANLLRGWANAVEPEIHATDIILIGHSRGSVVISQAVQALFRASNVLPESLKRGYVKMIMLDPHPANNNGAFYSFSFSRLGLLARYRVRQFQAAANDPEVTVPSYVDSAEVYYQHTLSSSRPILSKDFVFNLWGKVPVLPVQGWARKVNLTDTKLPNGEAIGHGGVVDWYLNRIRIGVPL